jgi:hypothetical protein
MSYVINPLLAAGLDNIGNDGATTPGGSNTQVQFNDSGAMAGDSGLTFNKTTNALTIGASTVDGGQAKVFGDINLDDGGTFTTTIQCVTPTLTNKTISFPDATGTVALVAGSSGQLVYNNAGSNAGATGSVVDSSGNVTIGGLTTLAGSPSANNTSGVLINGTWRTGASSNNPQLLLNPSGTTLSTTWSPSGTGIGVNAPASFGGNLLDLQVNGTSQFRLNSSGNLVKGSSTWVFDASVGTTTLPNSITLQGSGNINLPLAGNITWSGGAGIGASANVLNLSSPGTFNRITIGGTTSSHPALKKNSAELQVRLADDSGFTTIDAQLRSQGTAPASASATGTAGDIRYDADYIYVCTATNTWKRAALATW